jgi:GntR family transcriptional regulator, galactonate operon transcriptional repressor
MSHVAPASNFLSPHKRSLFSHVVEDLGMRILRGDLSPDQPFPKEADLEVEFRASRSVIREAVKTLAAKGLLESRPRTGTRVLPPVHWTQLDAQVLGWRYRTAPPAQFFGELFELRLMIEPESAALAAERATGEDLAEIRAAYRAMTDASEASAPGIDADVRFHCSILAAAHNPLLLQMGNLIAAGLQISHRYCSESFEIFLLMHAAILQEIEAKNADAARSATRRLLLESRDFLKAHIHDEQQ